ncbi:peptidylprolyl isomerase [Haloferula sp. A504]|uniref:peptidylprolyl isomerase n=1 Tax=Haloferula sp. A504 TaxID=3373601 RepID=UPI0031C44750|nr:peptidylprolyl isomerase [Verrucomicrobiaceae bacterium E54]
MRATRSRSPRELLAEGGANRVRSVDGAVVDGPRYDGQAFRVTDGQRAVMSEASFEDGGYCFADEFSASLRHEPYVLALDNVGPNTNGGSWYLTGNATLSERDDRYVVFGRVPGAASRSVVDAILSNPPATTNVTGITIRKTGPVEEQFDETAVALPEVLPASGPIRVGTGVVEMNRFQVAASVLMVTRSDDLEGWQPQLRRMRAWDEVPFADWIAIDTPAARGFYQCSQVIYPEGDLPSGFANRILTLTGPGLGTLIYHFDSGGLGGSYENILQPGEPPLFEGNFTVRTDLAYRISPVAFEIMIESEGLGGSPFNLIVGGGDSMVGGNAFGRHRTIFLSTPEIPTFTDHGQFELTAP